MSTICLDKGNIGEKKKSKMSVIRLFREITLCAFLTSIWCDADLNPLVTIIAPRIP